MAATLIEIADAVAAVIRTSSLSIGATAERKYVPVRELKELDRLCITVVPAQLSMIRLSRRDDDFDYVVDVGVQTRVGGTGPDPPGADAIDPLMRFVEEIVDLFRGKHLPYGDGDDSALCNEVANAPVFDPAHLDEKRVFTSVVTLTFRAARSR